MFGPFLSYYYIFHIFFIKLLDFLIDLSFKKSFMDIFLNVGLPSLCSGFLGEGSKRRKNLRLRRCFFYFLSLTQASLARVENKKTTIKSWFLRLFGGERGIRTPGPVTVNSFQDCRIRPLCHLSAANVGQETEICKK